MPREAILIRRVTAGAGGWAGDGAVWSATNQPPNAATAGTATGVTGYLRVLDGNGDAIAKRFNMRILAEWFRKDDEVRDWRQFYQSAATVEDPLELGDGEDFTTEPKNLHNARVAFHLVPVGGNLAEGSVVEIWAVAF